MDLFCFLIKRHPYKITGTTYPTFVFNLISQLPCSGCTLPVTKGPIDFLRIAFSLHLLYLSKLLRNKNLTDCKIEVFETNKSRLSDKKIRSNLPRTEKWRQFRLFRASSVKNLLPQDLDFLFPVGLKRRLLNFMWKQFEARFCCSNCRTLVLQCDCHNCCHNWNH